MIKEPWWAAISSRTDLKNAKLSALNSEGYALRNREIQTHELSIEAFAATYLVALYLSESQGDQKFPESLMPELEKRAGLKAADDTTAFNLFGLTHDEMKLRAKRVTLNLATLRGLESLSPGFRNFGEDTYDFYFIQEAQAKFLKNLTDDEIAELAAIADSQVVDWIPAHKEILIELFERRGTGFED